MKITKRDIKEARIQQGILDDDQLDRVIGIMLADIVAKDEGWIDLADITALAITARFFLGDKQYEKVKAILEKEKGA